MQVEKMLEKYQNLNEEEKKCVNIIVKEKDQNLSEEGKYYCERNKNISKEKR